MGQYRGTWIKGLVLAALVGGFLLTACCKLTFSSLWFDEGIEYWYSKSDRGPLPFERKEEHTDDTMYDRIISTAQPPLYNVLMHGWLRVQDTELWFRLFGVLCGLTGTIGLFLAGMELSGFWAGAAAAVAGIFSYRLVYYWQECAEYCLMLCFLEWMLYFWVRGMKDLKKRDWVLFVVFGTAAVFSQYGAAFSVLVLGVVLLFQVIRQGTRGDKQFFLVICLAALVLGAFPLWHWFLKPQLLLQQGAEAGHLQLSLPGMAAGFFRSFLTVFRWSFLQDAPGAIIGLALLLCVGIVLTGCLLERHSCLGMYGLANLFVWLLTWMAVESGLYARTNYMSGFGNRYGLFLLPIWLLLIISSAAACVRKIQSMKIRIMVLVVGVAILFLYAGWNWGTWIRPGWEKSSVREMTEEWRQAKPEAPIIVSAATAPVFAYYQREMREEEDRILYLSADEQAKEAAFSDRLERAFSEGFPETIYLAVSREDLDGTCCQKTLENMGYYLKSVYERLDARLMLAEKTETG